MRGSSGEGLVPVVCSSAATSRPVVTLLTIRRGGLILILSFLGEKILNSVPGVHWKL